MLGWIESRPQQSTPAMVNLTAILRYLGELAPLELAESWDNVGLLLGDEQASVARVMTCLTLTTDVAVEAIAERAELIVTHHPILFKPVQKLTTRTAEGRMVWELARQGVSVYSPHTAWDSAPRGINQRLAEALGLTDIAPLKPTAATEWRKVVTFVPSEQLEAVQRAVWQAGAGRIGHYDSCSFYHPGTGTFQGDETTHPAVGTAGQFERAEELRLEVVVAAGQLGAVLTALRGAHPYEEPAIDVYPLLANGASQKADRGVGRWGRLNAPVTLGELRQRVATQLQVTHVPMVGDEQRTVTRVGIGCGAAGEFLRDAHRLGCDVYVTGEARFHAACEARELGIGLLLPGHYATERFAMEQLASDLQRQFTNLSCWASREERDPLQ